MTCAPCGLADIDGSSVAAVVPGAVSAVVPLDQCDIVASAVDLDDIRDVTVVGT